MNTRVDPGFALMLIVVWLVLIAILAGVVAVNSAGLSFGIGWLG